MAYPIPAWNKGLKIATDSRVLPASEETRAKMRLGHKRHPSVVWNRGLTKGSNDPRMLRNYTKESGIKKSRVLKERKVNVGRVLTLEHRNQIGKKLRGRLHSKEHIRKVLSRVCASPNRFETKALVHINRLYGGNFVFVGDGSFLVDRKSPDAVNYATKTVALFNGLYWHLRKKGYEVTEENKRMIEARESIPFVTAGYKVLFVWEDEI